MHSIRLKIPDGDSAARKKLQRLLADQEGVQMSVSLEKSDLEESDEEGKAGVGADQRNGHLLVRDRGRIVVLPVGRIRYIQSDGNYLELHTDEATYLVRATFKKMSRHLDPERFVRIHRSTVVNLEYVAEFRPRPRGSYEVLLRDGTSLTLSRTYRDQVLSSTL